MSNQRNAKMQTGKNRPVPRQKGPRVTASASVSLPRGGTVAVRGNRARGRTRAARRANGIGLGRPRPGLTLAAASRIEAGKESVGSLLGINGFGVVLIPFHPGSFPLRLDPIAKHYSQYRLVSLTVRVTSYLAANDRGEFAIGFDTSDSITLATDFKSMSDIVAIGGVRMQAGEATKSYVVDCRKFGKPYYHYHSLLIPDPATPPQNVEFDAVPGVIVLGVAGTPVNGQTVGDVEIDFQVELSKWAKVPSDHAVGALAPVFASTFDGGVMKTYHASLDESRSQPPTSVPHRAFIGKSKPGHKEVASGDLSDIWSVENLKNALMHPSGDAEEETGETAEV